MKIAENEPTEESKCTKLLNSLPKKYDSVVTAIEIVAGNEKKLSLCDIKVQLIDYE